MAECDIKSFFDCVSHQAAIDSLEELESECRQREPGFRIDDRARKVFLAYLGCYSFKGNVLGEGRELLLRKDKDASFPWPEEDLKRLHSGNQLDKIGVPQGGALSCLIANTVLHTADKALKHLSQDGALTYLRYCDDMILFAGEQRLCQEGFGEYAKALERRLLPAHPAKDPRPYSKQFYQGKSHQPYRWAKGEIPWIQFVGYQVRYDGLVRVRSKSVKKESRKITKTADQLISVLALEGKNPSLATHIKKTQRQILHRFRQKLISMSVGRIALSSRSETPMAMCWANGFRGLRSRTLVMGALVSLDRQRERQIARVLRRLRLLPVLTKGTDSKVTGVLKFYGGPYSYYGQFKPPAAPVPAPVSGTERSLSAPERG